MKTRTNSNHRKTRKHTKTINMQSIVTTFLQMLNTVKLYHWKTTSYAQHKATDELYAKLNENIDTFVEIMLGKTNKRVDLTHQLTLPLMDYNNLSSFESIIEKYKIFLISMNASIDSANNSDLLNVRDEILGNLNQFSYLLTFK